MGVHAEQKAAEGQVRAERARDGDRRYAAADCDHEVVQGQVAALPADNLNPRAHFFGDSFVAGYLDPEGLGWVGRLAKRAPGVDFVNHGVPGATSEACVQQWLVTSLDPERIERVVFSFGTNDVIYGVPTENSLAALTSALDRASQLLVPAYVVGPPDAPGIADAYAGICAARDIPYFDTVAPLGPGSVWRAEASAGDGSHPGAGGYAELAELLDRAGLTDWLTAPRV